MCWLSKIIKNTLINIDREFVFLKRNETNRIFVVWAKAFVCQVFL